MPVDTTELRAIAARVKRQTTNPDILELCDAALARAGCLVCDARRMARTASQRKWREKKSGASDG